jgi:DDE family transposase
MAAEAAGPDRDAAGRPGGDGEDDALAWYGDSAYGTGTLRAAIADAGYQAVIKPKPVQPAVPGGFTADDFTVDAAAGTVTCPAGITRRVTARNAVIFGAACRDCPLRERCTTAKDGRTLHLHEHDSLLRAARADWAAGPELRQDYMTRRPHVERAIAQVATWRGRRLKLRYRGTARNHAWLKRRTAAVNLRTLPGRGLTRRDGTWLLVT